jgi:voltage-gated potassium channel
MTEKNQNQPIIIFTNYELFVVLVILLSVTNHVLWLFSRQQSTRNLILFIEQLISAFLLLDFFIRLIRGRDKRAYFLRGYGWLDLLGSLPVIGLRLARLVRPLVLSRKIHRQELSAMGNVIVYQRAQSTFLAVLFVALVIFEISGIAILQTEAQNPEANIQTASDALWWAYVTVATVGYGDRYPVTTNGRIVGVLLMTAGVGLFSVLTSYLADWFRRPHNPIQKAQSPADERLPLDARAGLDEIQRLLEEHQTQHQQTMAELQARLDKIKRSLDG